ncbi:hypothetical protein P1P75_34350 [Streptomyces sp. ID05-39B]|uniref:hypothetical protein n=1 Tax=Streptomyces sp. ID05-39B TaxID=3028664 RepID=UPI0029AF1E84|nr:hypothetical protein [Streptomyces sp. ID05-39B]MDX3531338.1 hypothetical protein [Streptomyces sp. ID05-39B]MDX3531343.1 hypothetical protein [Streptomyces sp. ID05-39B]
MHLGVRRLAAAGAVMMGAGLMMAPSAAADETGTQSCPPDVWYKVVSSGASYEAVGSTAGKYNSSSTASILRYDLTTTRSKQTSWGAEAGGSVSWGIWQVEAKTSFDITNSTTSGKTVSNTINVPGRSYGYTTPKVERRKFTVEKWQDTPGCGARFLGNMGTLSGITAYPFFSECTARSACTPKP